MGTAKQLLGAALTGLLALSPAYAEHYTAIGKWEAPFTSVESLREEGHSIHVLYADSTAKIARALNKQIEPMPNAAKEEVEGLLDELSTQLDSEHLEKSIRTDMAVKKLVRELQLRDLPAVLVRRHGKLLVVYGVTDMKEAAQKLDREIK